MIGRAREPHAAAGGAAGRRVPCDVHVVAERARGVAVGRDHRLVVEVIGAACEREQRELRIRPAAVGRPRDADSRPVDPVPVPEVHDDVAVEDVAARIERERRIGSEVDAVSLRRRQRQIDAAPARAAVGREVAAHRQPEDFVRAAGEHLRLRRVQRDERFALRTAFVRDVDVRPHLEARLTGARVGAVGGEVFVLAPPRRLVRVVGLGARRRGERD